MYINIHTFVNILSRFENKYAWLCVCSLAVCICVFTVRICGSILCSRVHGVILTHSYRAARSTNKCMPIWMWTRAKPSIHGISTRWQCAGRAMAFPSSSRQRLWQINMESTSSMTRPLSDSKWSPTGDVISSYQSKSMQSFYELLKNVYQR